MKQNKKEQKEEVKHTYKDSLRELIPYAIIIITVVLIRTFLITPIKVNGTSMTDTLQNKDLMILNKIGPKLHNLKRFQIIVIDTPDSYLIKRIIGLPGEFIKYEIKEENGNKKGILYVNNKIVKEEFLSDDTTSKTCYSEETNICKDGVKIPEDSYYVMGDNRGNSVDSRIIGTIEKKNIWGSTKLVIYPISDIGIVK